MKTYRKPNEQLFSQKVATQLPKLNQNMKTHIWRQQHKNRRGGSNEYPQSMFWSKNKKNRYTPANPFCYIKVGFNGVNITRTCFPDVLFIVLIFHHYLYEYGLLRVLGNCI